MPSPCQSRDHKGADLTRRHRFLTGAALIRTAPLLAKFIPGNADKARGDPMKKAAIEPAVVLYSGGLNAAVAAAIAAQEQPLALLHVHYGQQNQAGEDLAFEALAERIQPKERLTLDLPHIAKIAHGTKFDPRQPPPNWSESITRLAETSIPGLMAAMLTAAQAWAARIGASKVYLGISEKSAGPLPQLSAVRPEWSREFVQVWNHLQNVTSVDAPMVIEAPLIDLSRGEIVKLGARLDVPFELTRSCQASGDEVCGNCLGCASRAHGFLDAGLPDPILAQAVTA